MAPYPRVHMHAGHGNSGHHSSTPAEALLGAEPHLLLCSPQNLVRWCDSSPCKNGGKCWQTNNLYRCECNSGWTGLYCDVPSVSCEVAAKQQGQSLAVSGLAGLGWDPQVSLCWALSRDVLSSLGRDLWHNQKRS